MSQQTHSNRAAVLAVVAVAAVVVVTLVIVQMLGGEQEPGPGTASDEPAVAVATPPPGECNEPPPLAEQPKKFDKVPDQATAEGTSWIASVATNCGNIVMELDGAKAPQTVASFLFLARQNYYDASPCHRLVTSGIFVLQCGDPSGTGSGGPGYGFGVENAPEDYVYPRGTLAMARTSDPESNGSQFFIVYDKTELPDPNGYTIFGEVIEGMDIVDRIAESGVGGTLGPEAPQQPISILDITVAKDIGEP